jgi:capsid portal protein
MQANGQASNPLNTAAATESKTKAVVANSFKLPKDYEVPIGPASDALQVVYGKKYIPFLDSTDTLANILWGIRLQSPTQNACITTITETCIGEGLFVSNKKPDEVDPDFIKWIGSINNDNQSLNEVCKDALDAMQTDGNAWVEIVKGKIGGLAYVKPYIHTTLTCRYGPLDNKTLKPSHIVKSNQLAKTNRGVLNARNLKAVNIPLYSPNSLDQKAAWQKLDNGDFNSCIHLKNAISGVQFYGLPRSFASVDWQILEHKNAQYNNDMFDNNMVLSALLVFKSAMTQAEAAKTAKEIIKTHTGQGKMGRVAVVSSEGGIDDFELKPLETQKEGSFIELDKRAEAKIITSHNWDPVLAGISRDSAFGNGSQYIRAVFDVKKAMVLKPMADYMLSKFVKPLVNIAANQMNKKEWLDYELSFKHAMPFSFISDIDVNSVLTKDEGREILGQQKLEDTQAGKGFIKTSNTQNKPTDVPGESTK